MNDTANNQRGEPEPAESASAGGQAALPTAQVHRPRRMGWLWLIPALAAAFAAALFVSYGLKRGPVITIVFASGNGIEPSHVLRCRGIVVGEVEDVRLLPDLAGVAVELRLEPGAAEQVARAGSRFWVVRPQVGPRGVAGLETIAGPRYLAVSPGEEEPQTRFTGLEEPPVVERIDPAGLEITLVADSRQGLRPGAAVLYRGVEIGRVLSVGLASDATSVEARAYIRPIYAALVRPDSRFWSVSGAAMEMGLRGLRVEVESLTALLDGGVAMATPEDAGGSGGSGDSIRAVRTGHRFKLHAEPEEEWKQWRPGLAVGTELLPSGAAAPAMQRVTVSQRRGLLWLKRQRKGWLLPTPAGLVGPADLLAVGEDAEVEVAGQQVPLDEATVEVQGLLATLQYELQDVAAWPLQRVRAMQEAEDCVVIAERTETLRPIAAGHLQPGENGTWAVSPMISLSDDLHGAAVLSREDGMLVGLLLVERGQGMIAPMGAIE